MRKILTASGFGLALLFSAWAAIQSLGSGETSRLLPSAQALGPGPEACPVPGAPDCGSGGDEAELGPPPLEYE